MLNDIDTGVAHESDCDFISPVPEFLMRQHEVE